MWENKAGRLLHLFVSLDGSLDVCLGLIHSLSLDGTLLPVGFTHRKRKKKKMSKRWMDGWMDGWGSMVTIKKAVGKGIDENALPLSFIREEGSKANGCVGKSDDEGRCHLARWDKGAVIGVGSGR